MKKTGHMPALLIFLALTSMTFLSLEGSAQAIREGILYFKSKVKIPFSLQSGSKVFKPGEYLLMIRTEGGQPVLIMQSDKGDVLMRTYGEYDIVPERDRNFKRTRLTIASESESESPGKRWIVFTCDTIRGVGTYTRIRFKIREASERE